RAVRYLATLQRVEVMTTREAEASLRQQEMPISPVKVEQDALVVAFKGNGRVRYLHSELRDPALAEQVQRSIKSRLEEAASDQFSQYYLSDKYLVRVDTKTGKFVYGWEHA